MSSAPPSSATLVISPDGHTRLVDAGGPVGQAASPELASSNNARWDVGEEVVAFIVLNQRGEGVSIGLSQGKFHIWPDPVTGEKLAHNHFHGLHPTATNSSASNAPPAKIINRLTFADLKQRAQGGAK